MVQFLESNLNFQFAGNCVFLDLGSRAIPKYLFWEYMHVKSVFLVIHGEVNKGSQYIPKLFFEVKTGQQTKEHK